MAAGGEQKVFGTIVVKEANSENYPGQRDDLRFNISCSEPLQTVERRGQV